MKVRSIDNKVIINPEDVLERKNGWVKYYDKGGGIRKDRTRNVVIGIPLPVQFPEEEAPATVRLKPSETEIMASSKKKAVKGAKAKGKKTAAVVGEAAGTRTVGGKVYDISGYTKVKTNKGHTSYDNGDKAAELLRGKDLDATYAIVAKKVDQTEKDLKAKYKHLNTGMQRMALGNMLRKAMGLTKSAAA